VARQTDSRHFVHDSFPKFYMWSQKVRNLASVFDPRRLCVALVSKCDKLSELQIYLNFERAEPEYWLCSVQIWRSLVVCSRL